MFVLIFVFILKFHSAVQRRLMKRGWKLKVTKPEPKNVLHFLLERWLKHKNHLTSCQLISFWQTSLQVHVPILTLSSCPSEGLCTALVRLCKKSCNPNKLASAFILTPVVFPVSCCSLPRRWLMCLGDGAPRSGSLTSTYRSGSPRKGQTNWTRSMETYVRCK